MYTREIQAPRKSPIENGKPLQGTWISAFSEMDLLDISRPFSVPLPKWMREFRIKEWETFAVRDDRFFLEGIVVNLKYYRWAQVCLYDLETKKELRFRKLIPLHAWRLPRDLHHSSLLSRSYGFFFHIHHWLDADTIKIDIDIEAARNRPSFTAHLEYDAARQHTTPMTVSLLFTERRSMYAYKVLSPVRGDMVSGGQHISLNPERTVGIFGDYKGYYPYRMRSTWCTGLSADPEHRQFGFSIAESQTRQPYKNNENALWVGGKLTPLPPVRITMPGGPDKEWVIQDVEGMVDLTFTPQAPRRTAFNLLLTRTEYETPLGHFNGMLMDSGGEQIRVRNLWGRGEKLYLRI